MSENNAIVPVQTAVERALAEKRDKLRRYLEHPEVLEQLAKAMPRHLDANRMLRQVFSLAAKNPTLLDCTRYSLYLGMMAAAELGLELTGPLGHAWLIPRKVKGVLTACFQIGYRGLAALAMRAPTLRNLEVGLVHENDDFDYQMGTNSYVQHRAAKGERGAVTHYYAIAKYVSGGHDFEVWTAEKARQHQQRFGNSKPDSPWNNHFDAMALKSVVSALCRRQSLCPEAQEVANKEHYEEVGVLTTVPQSGGKTALLLGKLDDLDDSPADTEPASDMTTT